MRRMICNEPFPLFHALGLALYDTLYTFLAFLTVQRGVDVRPVVIPHFSEVS